MKKEKNMIAIVALIVAIVGLSVGFAAFTSTITLSTTGTYTPDSSDWNVEFYGTPTVEKTGNATCGVGTASGTSWSGITATLTGPGDSCKWTGTIKNTGEYIAYLTEISLDGEDVLGQDGITISDALTCTPDETNPSTNATSACSSIHFTITPTVAGSSISVDGTQTVTLTLSYPSDATSTDEEITLSIKSIGFRYSSRS